MKYEMCKTWMGYEISKPRSNSELHLYLHKVYKGEYTWCSDYLYAKHFSKKTAEKHIKILEDKE